MENPVGISPSLVRNLGYESQLKGQVQQLTNILFIELYFFSVQLLSFHGGSATTSSGHLPFSRQDDHNFDFHVAFDEPCSCLPAPFALKKQQPRLQSSASQIKSQGALQMDHFLGMRQVKPDLNGASPSIYLSRPQQDKRDFLVP